MPPACLLGYSLYFCILCGEKGLQTSTRPLDHIPSSTMDDASRLLDQVQLVQPGRGLSPSLPFEEEAPASGDE